MSEIKLSCGVLIIGSLFWDVKNGRDTWRKRYLNLDSKKLIDLPIRYGRKSSTRSCTYTMVFSNDCANKLGKAYIVPFKEVIHGIKDLLDKSIDLAKAEGICQESEMSLYKSWGCVAIFINPRVDTKVTSEVRAFWMKQYQNTINPSCFRINDEKPCVDKYGFLQLDCTLNTKDCDVILATPVTINAERYPSSKEIADAIVKKKNEYFCKNVQNGIATFQDAEIKKYLQ
jgi:hypothetical protein